MKKETAKEIRNIIAWGIGFFIFTAILYKYWNLPLDWEWIRNTAMIYAALVGFELGLKSGWRRQKKKKEPKKEGWDL